MHKFWLAHLIFNLLMFLKSCYLLSGQTPAWYLILCNQNVKINSPGSRAQRKYFLKTTSSSPKLQSVPDEDVSEIISQNNIFTGEIFLLVSFVACVNRSISLSSSIIESSLVSDQWMMLEERNYLVSWWQAGSMIVWCQRWRDCYCCCYYIPSSLVTVKYYFLLKYFWRLWQNS